MGDMIPLTRMAQALGRELAEEINSTKPLFAVYPPSWVPPRSDWRDMERQMEHLRSCIQYPGDW